MDQKSNEKQSGIDKSIRKRRCVTKTILLLILLFVMMFANWFHPLLRFSYPVMNNISALVWSCLPVAIILVMFSSPVIWIRILGIVFMVPALCFTLFFGSFFLDDISRTMELGYEASCARLETISSDDYQVSLYRTNGGATTAFGIVVQQEMRIVPGLLLVRPLAQYYPAKEAKGQFIGKNRVRITIPLRPYYKPEAAGSHEFTLKRFVYF